MCGRYALYVPVSSFQDVFAANSEGLVWTPRYNIAPLQFAPVIRQRPTGERVTHLLRWGMIPSWSKDESIGTKLINARGETLAEKPSFRAAYKARRCIIPASGFYEWQKIPGGKQPYFIRPTYAALFAFAGLWERWTPAGGDPLDTFTVITTSANASMQPIHDRMPVILQPDDFGIWLDRETSMEAINPLIRPSDGKFLQMYQVSKAVGNVGNDSPELIAALPTAE